MNSAPSRGMTLLELLVVVVVLATLAGFVSVAVQPPASDARLVATETTLRAVRDAIVGSPTGPRTASYFADMRALPETMADLLRRPPGASAYNEQTRSGWRGPYVTGQVVRYEVNLMKNFTAVYGSLGEPTLDDAFDHDDDPLNGWLSPIVIQYPDPPGDPTEDRRYVRLVSAGPDGILDTPTSVASNPELAYYPPISLCGDDLVLYLRVADLRPGTLVGVPGGGP